MNRKSIKSISIILAIALLARISWVLFTPALPTSDFATYNNIAHRLVDGQGYITAYRVPGYPVFLASLYTFFGDHLLVPKLANAIMSTLTCLFTFLIAWKCFNYKIALVSASIVSLLPSHILYSGLLASETLFTCLMLASTALFLFALERDKMQWLLLVLSGFGLGFSALTRPIALFLPGVWMLFLLWKRYSLKQVTLIISVVCITVLVVFMPWIIRNYLITGRFVIQTNGGFNWYLGFNERASGHYSGQILREFIEAAKEMGLNEFETDKLAYERAFQFIREHPVRSLALIPLKWFHLFKHDVSGVVWSFKITRRPFSPVLWLILIFIAQAYYMALMAFVLVGIYFLRKSHTEYPGYGLVTGFILYWLAFHALTIGVDRFHIPLLPILAMFSAVGIWSLWQQFQSHRNEKKLA